MVKIKSVPVNTIEEETNIDQNIQNNIENKIEDIKEPNVEAPSQEININEENKENINPIVKEVVEEEEKPKPIKTTAQPKKKQLLRK